MSGALFFLEMPAVLLVYDVHSISGCFPPKASVNYLRQSKKQIIIEVYVIIQDSESCFPVFLWEADFACFTGLKRKKSGKLLKLCNDHIVCT